MAKVSTNSKTDVAIHIGIILSILVLVGFIFFFIYLPWSTNHGQSITVPDLRGMTLEEMENVLDERDLEYEVNDCTFSIKATPRTILSQFPKFGSKVKSGRKIYISVAAQTPPLIAMPKLIDRSLSTAENLLKSNDLLLGAKTYKPDLAENTILDQLYNGQSIRPGDKIPKGSKIDLVIGDGLGNQVFEAPNLLGKTLEECQLILSGSDLNIGTIIYDNTVTEPAGTVFKQNPKAEQGNKVRVGDVIDLWIAGDPAPQPSSDEQTP